MKRAASILPFLKLTEYARGIQEERVFDAFVALKHSTGLK